MSTPGAAEDGRFLDRLAQLEEPNLEESSERLKQHLAEDARSAGLLDVGYRTVASPIGDLLLAATHRGLVRVAFAREGHDAVLGRLAELISPRILRAPSMVDEVSRQLEEYFAGGRTEFEVDLDLRLAAGFRRSVLTHLPRIAYGNTQSYSTVAAALGSPRAVRAVGSACATNPLPVVVPCHRVVRSDGSLGGYAGGLEAKHSLLDLESRE